MCFYRQQDVFSNVSNNVFSNVSNNIFSNIIMSSDEKYVPHSYPFNNRVLTNDTTNYFKKYENVIFSDKEYLKSNEKSDFVKLNEYCVTVSVDGNTQSNSCVKVLDSKHF